jgi:membrane protease YdiL (CAAX protease family)
LQQLVGAWWFFGLLVVFSIFNVLGEEFLFRGVLLPRMQGVFGKWNWVASGVLSAFYHLHQPWTIAANIIQGVLLLAFPRWRFRSTWMGVIVHSVENVFGGILTLGIILGLA